MTVAVCGDPGTVVDELQRRDQRTCEVDRDLAEPSDGPAGDSVVGNIGVHEVEVVSVVEGHVALVAELMLLNAERRKAGNISPRVAAVNRKPSPRHAAGEGRRVSVRR